MNASFNGNKGFRILIWSWVGLTVVIGFNPTQAQAFESFQLSKNLELKDGQMSHWIAQVDPSQNRFPLTGPAPESLPPSPLEPEEQTPVSEPESLPESMESGTEAVVEQIVVQQITVVGSTVFSQADLQQVLSAYAGQSLTVAELQAAAEAITRLYISRGYITSRAILPEQTLVDGVVDIQVIEGQLEEIQVAGTNQLADYIRSRVGLGVGKPLNQPAVEDQLRLLQLDPLFDSIQASLKPGSAAGSTILVVEAAIAAPFSGSVGIDTLSPPSVGRYRLGATLQYRNLTGLGDTLFASAYGTTTGGSETYELGYRVPVNPMNGTLQFRIAPNFFRITDPDEPGFALGQRGSTDSYEVSFRQPLVRTPQEEFALSLAFRYRQGSTLIPGIILPPVTTSVFSFGQDYTRRDFSGAWVARSEFRLGTGLFEATANPTLGGADGQFFSWLGQAQRVQVLNPNNLLIVSADVQLTPDQLLSSEQFYLGGDQSVRGYYQNTRFGDNGMRFSVEDRITLLREDKGRAVVQVIPFIDLGYVWNNQTASFFDQNFLLGTGVGFALNPLPDLSANVGFGVPLITLDETSTASPSGPQLYFDVRYQF